MLQDQQFPIDQAIYTQLLACLPEGWSRVKLLANLQPANNGTQGMSIRIDGLGQPGIALVSDQLEGQVRELFLLNQRYRTGLRGISYSYTRQPTGHWAFAADYQYT